MAYHRKGMLTFGLIIAFTLVVVCALIAAAVATALSAGISAARPDLMKRESGGDEAPPPGP
jgi:hypothetical protein